MRAPVAVGGATGTGHLEIGGSDAVELARTYGTPAYVYDEQGLRDTCGRFSRAFSAVWPRVSVAYACKAFATVAMMRLAAEEGLDLDLASVGELSLAQRAGVSASRLTLHGVVKTSAELDCAVAAGVGHIVIDSPGEVDDVVRAAACHRRQQPVLVRINPGTEVATDGRYRASGADTKFGLAINDGSARAAALAAQASEHLRLDGIHFHLGSQLMSVAPFAEAMTAARAFLAQLPQWRPARVVVGGGMGVDYGEGPTPPTPDQWADSIAADFRHKLAPLCAPDVTLGVEPGRAVVADHGCMLYTVASVKARAGGPGEVIVVVDGGLSDNPRPLMYSARHQVVSARQPHAPSVCTAHIYGRSCETDLLFTGVRLPAVSRGDVLAVHTTGAYTHCMASNYNRFFRPPVVFASAGSSRLVVRRETAADLTRTELGE